MKNPTLNLALACFCSIPVAGSAATASASFQASLTIVESCAIDSGAQGTAPAIACSHARAWRLDAAPAGTRTQKSHTNNILTVTF